MVRVFWTNYRAYKSKTNVILNLSHNSIENCPTRKLIVAWREKLWADVVNMKMIFHSFSNATHFHLKSLALSRIKLYSKTIIVFLSLKLQLNFFSYASFFAEQLWRTKCVIFTWCTGMTQNWMTWEVSVSKTCVGLLTRDSSTSRQTLMSRYQAVDQKWRWKETLAKVGGSFNETVTIVLWETITWIQLGSISQSHTGFFFLFFIKPLLAVGLAICRIFVVVNGFRFQVVFKRLRIVWVKFPVGYRLSRVFSESFRFYMGGFGFYAEGFDGAFLFFQFHLIFSARLTLLLSLSSFWPRNPSRCRAKQSADFFFVSFLLIAGQLWWKW